MGRQLGAWAGPFPSQFPDGYLGNVWDRQRGESDQAFEAFRVYRDLGLSRSLDAVAAKRGGMDKGKKSANGRIRAWSTNYSWTQRADAYDVWTDRERQKALSESIRTEVSEAERTRERQLRRLMTLAEKSLDKVEEYLSFPVRKRTGSVKDPKTGVDQKVTLEPLPPTTMKAVGVMMGQMYSLLRQPLSGVDPKTPVPSLPPLEVWEEPKDEDDSASFSEQAERELAEWDAQGADAWPRPRPQKDIG